MEDNLSKDELQDIANSFTVWGGGLAGICYRGRCPFCGRVTRRQSQGGWPVYECKRCDIRFEIRVIAA
jgi:hypothetical protein